MSDSDYSIPAGSRPIHGAPGYRICDGGTVWSCHATGRGHYPAPWHIIKPRKYRENNKYVQVALRVKGRGDQKYWQVLVHNLVLAAFVGPRPPRMHCRHLDGNPLNNHVSNLKWDTKKNNEADKSIHGTLTLGERNGYAKLRNADIPEIFRLSHQGFTLRCIAEKFGLRTTGTVANVLKRKTWRHIPVQSFLF